MKAKSKVIFLRKNLVKEVRRLRRQGKKIVFTNGVYDLLHVGHIKLLTKARKFGDILVLAINSDASVRRIKGDKRPMIPQKERAEVLAALECVDIVTVFYEDDPFNIVNDIIPDVLVKGGDWKIKDIIGADVVRANGGTVKNIKYEAGKSTTNIVKKVLKYYK